MGTWSGLADVIRGTAPPAYPDTAAADSHVAAASEALGITEAVLAALDPPGTGRVADLGGGLGTSLRRWLVATRRSSWSWPSGPARRPGRRSGSPRPVWPTGRGGRARRADRARRARRPVHHRACAGDPGRRGRGRLARARAKVPRARWTTGGLRAGARRQPGRRSERPAQPRAQRRCGQVVRTSGAAWLPGLVCARWVASRSCRRSRTSPSSPRPPHDDHPDCGARPARRPSRPSPSGRSVRRPTRSTTSTTSSATPRGVPGWACSGWPCC